MNEKSNQRQNRRQFKIENVLPVKAVGVECLRESIPTTMSPHRYIYKWFARRPTAATRLAVLSSVLPPDISDDELLSLMQIGPKHSDQLNGSISDYVIQRRGEWENGERNGSLVEHYGYDFSHSSSPSESELEEFHNTLRSH
jgi:adenine-specific DNA methylase